MEIRFQIPPNQTLQIEMEVFFIPVASKFTSNSIMSQFTCPLFRRGNNTGKQGGGGGGDTARMGENE
jgi:hypothetical protein